MFPFQILVRTEPARSRRPSAVASLSFLLAAFGSIAFGLGAEANTAWRLLSNAQVDARGVFLQQVLVEPPLGCPPLRLAPAPALTQTTVITRTQILELLRLQAPELATTNWTGPQQITIQRRSRPLEEPEVLERLTAVLQKESVRDRGELELRLTRPWPATLIADEACAVRILELPTAGVSQSFIVRFELLAGKESLGTWQVPVQARIWREVWISGSPLPRGQSLRTADLVAERRDILAFRDALPAVAFEDPALELAENLVAGVPLTLRMIRSRPLIHRGTVVDAVVADGSMTISIKVEALEDGLRGQSVRVRNLKSRHEFWGKVQNEETILVTL